MQTIFLITGSLCFLTGSIIHLIQISLMLKKKNDLSKVDKLIKDHFNKLADITVDDKEKPKANA